MKLAPPKKQMRKKNVDVKVVLCVNLDVNVGMPKIDDVEPLIKNH